MSSEAPFSFTTKVNNNDLFTVRGDDYDSFLKNLTLAYNIQGVRVLVDALNGITEQQAIGNVISTLSVATPIEPVAPPAFAPSIAVPQASVAAPAATGGKTCAHGQMSARQGTGKDGKIWRGYMCPAPQGATDKCKNVYIYPNQPEWHTFVAG